MTLTIQTFVNYLGGPASDVLNDTPFRNWTFEKSFEPDLDEPLIDYVFFHNGVDFVCDGDDKVRSIFLYADESRCLREGLEDLPFASTRQQVIQQLGPPSKSGSRISDPILGEYGPWDRFARGGYAIHVEYRLDDDLIKKVTLMRADVAP